MRKLLLTAWIILKYHIAVFMGWIGDVQYECEYVKKYVKGASWDNLRGQGLEYNRDFIDSQFDSITALRKDKDDCDGWNRIAQIYWHNLGYEAYLVSYWSKQFRLSHTTCILKVDGIYIDCDYGFYGSGYYDFENCLIHISAKYGAKIMAYCVQDINWEIKDL